ncbi:hypothetical protein E2C01_030645 [Portunus trituberculatus]|uniref:Uncharacterized protein n=1 Tax=Portunus trituberculatus TaxID=210409 RepID=A0A5B7ERD4_PORTR|nr:hypothetical protein [Portunus trituberculatus]
MRFIKTKDPVVDGGVQSAKLPGDSKLGIHIECSAQGACIGAPGRAQSPYHTLGQEPITLISLLSLRSCGDTGRSSHTPPSSP